MSKRIKSKNKDDIKNEDLKPRQESTKPVITEPQRPVKRDEKKERVFHG